MKILLTLLLLSPLAFADMKSLDEYLQSQDEMGVTQGIYINYRCIGLYGMVANVTGGSSQDNSQNIRGIAEENSKKLMDETYKLWASVREDKSFEAYLQNLRDTVRPLADNYQRLANENWLNNGAYFEGNELLIGDITICGQMVGLFDE